MADPARPDPSRTDEPDQPAAVSIRTRISQLVPSLSPSPRRIAEEILARHDRAAGLTISELARRCQTSETSVVRFCHTLGLSGYPELRLALATEDARERAATPAGEAWGDDIEPGDDLARVLAKISYTERLAISETLGAVDVAELRCIVDAVDAAARMVCFGIGGSYLAALDLAQKLRRIGRHVLAFSDVHEATTTVALFGPGDVVLALSHSGVTLEPRHLVEVAGRHGATTIGVTNAAVSPLARAVDLRLTTAVRETPFRSGATASRISQLALIDALFVGVAQRHHADVARALEVTKTDTDRLR